MFEIDENTRYSLRLIGTGVIDSLDVQAGRVLVVLREENPSKTMYCYFPEMDNIDRIKIDQKYNIKGIFSSYNDTGFKLTDCRILE